MGENRIILRAIPCRKLVFSDRLPTQMFLIIMTLPPLPLSILPINDRVMAKC